MNPDSHMPPLTFDETVRLAAHLAQRGHGWAVVTLMGSIMAHVVEDLVPARHPHARPTGTGWPT